MENESKNIRSVSRAMDLLEIIRRKGGGIGVTDLSREIHLAKSTVYRITETLLEKGILSKDQASEKYSLGYKAFELAFSTSMNWNLVNFAMPFLEELRDLYNETTALALKIGLNYTYIAEAVSHQEFLVNPVLGKTYPLHWSGAGKAILAYTEGEELDEALKIVPSSRSTSLTITDPEVLKGQLGEIRRNGYATSFGERAQGAAVIAVPLRSPKNSAIGAICLVGPESRIRKMDIPATSDSIKKLCRQIEGSYRTLDYLW